MTFDDEAIDAATTKFLDMGYINYTDRARAALIAAVASMKDRGVDPCAEARREERDMNHPKTVDTVPLVTRLRNEVNQMPAQDFWNGVSIDKMTKKELIHAISRLANGLKSSC